jgi:hypothetical protein
MVKAVTVVATVQNQEIVDCILSKKIPYGMNIEEINHQTGFTTLRSFPYPTSKQEDCARFQTEVQEAIGNARIEEIITTRTERREAWGDI